MGALSTAGGNRRHAGDRIGAVSCRYVGEDRVGDDAECAAGHGANEQRRAEHAARKPETQTQRGGKNLGHRQQHQGFEGQCFAQGGVGGGIANTHDLGQPHAGQADPEAGDSRLDPVGRRHAPRQG